VRGGPAGQRIAAIGPGSGESRGSRGLALGTVASAEEQPELSHWFVRGLAAQEVAELIGETADPELSALRERLPALVYE